MHYFINRQDAGRRLAFKLKGYQNVSSVVCALSRGGVVVGYEIAKELDVPLDVVITKKIGHPHNAEYAVCVVNEDGHILCDEDEKGFVNYDCFDKQIEVKKQQISDQQKLYFQDKEHLKIENKNVILVDDGIATGLSIFSAIDFVVCRNPKKIIVAIPVCPHDIVEEVRDMVDNVVVIEDARLYLGSVGAYYMDFPEITDEEVMALLK